MRFRPRVNCRCFRGHYLGLARPELPLALPFHRSSFPAPFACFSVAFRCRESPYFSHRAVRSGENIHEFDSKRLGDPRSPLTGLTLVRARFNTLPLPLQALV